MAIDLTALTLAELRYAVALAEQRHFGRAARACNVTQPTLSAMVQKLERTLGVPLFERSPKTVELTTIGARVIEQARAVLDATEQIRELVQAGREPLAGPLRLGVIPTLGPYLLPHFVPALRAEYRELELVLRELKTSDLVDDLVHHRLDCGLLATPLHVPGLVAEELFEEPFWLLVPREHGLAHKKKVAEDDLAGERVLLLDEGHCLRDQALSLCGRAAALHSAGDFRATSLETLRHMVGAGMGTTLMPALALNDAEPSSGVARVPFSAPSPGRRVSLAWRKTHPRAADFRELAEFIRLNLPQGVTSVAGRPRVRR